VKISTEIKAAIIGLVAIGILIWGINYLKGRNVFRRTIAIYALYQEVSGLGTSAPIYMNGIKIGFVGEIIFLPASDPPVTLLLQIENQYQLREGSNAELFSADIMGTRAIRIIPSRKGGVLIAGDTISSAVVPDMFTNLKEEIFPVLQQIKGVAASLDSLGIALTNIAGSTSVTQTIDNLAAVSEGLKNIISEGGSLEKSLSNVEDFSSTLKDQDTVIASLIRNLSLITHSVQEAEMDQLILSFRQVTDQFNKLLLQVNSGEGSAGRLFYSDSLMLHMETLTVDLDFLIRDPQENPVRYIQFSVFGKSKKK